MGSYNIVPGTAKISGSCEQNTASLWITLHEGYISMNFMKVCQMSILLKWSANEISFSVHHLI